MSHRGCTLLGLLLLGAVAAPGRTDATSDLAAEVRGRGAVVYGARSAAGDWDLFRCRPDGAEVRPFTTTPGFNEFGPQFSRDGRRLLYRRVPRDERIDANHHGAQGELMIANADGSQAQPLGAPGEWPWASWSPDGRQLACLAPGGITLVDVTTRTVVRRLERRGFFQQTVWSPDGRWLVGVANAFDTGWSVARLELATGAAQAVQRVDCCTPDWFPDSQRVVFSWRPPGQGVNRGQGWTQLWMADASGTNRALLYAEDNRHIYGGNVSPDGAYVLFTGNLEEDGDPGHAGAPMGLMRLKDAPIIRGVTRQARAAHPDAHDGPVLTLPVGWEPCWTPAASAPQTSTSTSSNANEPAALAAEVRERGWIVCSARNGGGDWDLFALRPDGSSRHPLTRTTGFNEAGARFSPDGSRLLYYRMPREEPVDNNTYGTFELVIANADGSEATSYGRDFPWASWGPDGRQLACLTPQGIRIVELAGRTTVRELPRRGIVQQLVWSPDGRWFTGTANGLGPYWNIALLDARDGGCRALSETDRYNCTPDWRADATGVVYARGIIPAQGGRAELWWAPVAAEAPRRLHAETDRHIYGACASPDGRHLLFTRSVADLGKVDNSETTLALIRWPTGTNDVEGPRLDLGPGWEPHWSAVARLDQPGANATPKGEAGR